MPWLASIDHLSQTSAHGKSNRVIAPNYQTWSIHRRRVLSIKNKVINSVSSMVCSKNQMNWLNVQLVQSIQWLRHSLDIQKSGGQHCTQLLTFHNRFTAMWKTQDKYDDNALVRYQIIRNLASCAQRDDNIISYYMKLDAIWDDICAKLWWAQNHVLFRRTMRFFHRCKGTDTHDEALSTLDKIYQILVQDGHQRSVNQEPSTNTESTTLYMHQKSYQHKASTIGHNESGTEQQEKWCTGCKKVGHLVYTW